MRSDQILPDNLDHAEFNGVSVRKGTIAAFLANARTWANARASDDERARAQAQIVEDLAALRALGLFDVLEIRDVRLRAFVEGLAVEPAQTE